MIKSNTVQGKKGEAYQPNILCFQVMPGLEPELYSPLLESGLDAIIIGTVPTGGVPNEGEFSFITFIRRATELGVPVFLLRGSLCAARKPKYEYESYRRDMRVIYEPEIDAIKASIKAGGTPLERPDISMLLEVVETIRKIYTNRPGYDEGIGEVSRRYSSLEFMNEIQRIRQ